MSPIISDGLYKHLLIHRAENSGRALKPSKIPPLATPLVTKFEKWSGKRYKLFFEDECQATSSGLRNFELNNNIFAKLLASPMRSERNCKTKAPKELLMQLKLRSSQTNDKPLELVPSVEHSKINKNSYVVNSKSLLSQQIKSSSKWIPITVLTSPMRSFQTQDVAIDKTNFLVDFEKVLNQLLKDGLIEASNIALELQDGDAIACFNKDSNKSIEIRTYKLGDGRDISAVLFNLKYINPFWEQVINENKNHEEGVIIRCSENTRIVKLLYKTLAYHYAY